MLSSQFHPQVDHGLLRQTDDLYPPDREPIIAVVAAQSIVANTAIQQVVPQPTVDRVVAALAIELVVPGITVHNIIAKPRTH